LQSYSSAEADLGMFSRTGASIHSGIPTDQIMSYSRTCTLFGLQSPVCGIFGHFRSLLGAADFL